MLLVLVFLTILSVILHKLVSFLVKARRQARILRAIPSPPKESSIFGHVGAIHLSPTGLIQEMIKRCAPYGGISVLWFCQLPFVFLSRAEYVEPFFNARETRSKGITYNCLHAWLGLGLLTSGGEKWHKHRKLLTPAFHFSMLNSYCESMAKKSGVLVEKLRAQSKEAPIDVFKIMALTSLDNLCESAMGVKVDSLQDSLNAYVTATGSASLKSMERIVKPWNWNDLFFFNTAKGRKMKEDLTLLFKFNEQVIEDRRKILNLASQEAASIDTEKSQTGGEGYKGQVFLDVLLAATKPGQLTEQDLRDEVATFMFEGHDTTASALSFSLYLLGLHHGIQVKCFKELDHIFQNSERQPTMDDLKGMTYLEQVIKESLRLFPSVPLMTRRVDNDVQIGSYMVPEGTILGVNLYVLHRDPIVFPDPEKFDPDRFSRENVAERHPFAFVPFSAGLRNCIGQKFAMMEMKIVLSSILRNFELESTYGREQLKLSFGLTLRTKKSLDVRFKPRKTT